MTTSGSPRLQREIRDVLESQEGRERKVIRLGRFLKADLMDAVAEIDPGLTDTVNAWRRGELAEFIVDHALSAPDRRLSHSDDEGGSSEKDSTEKALMRLLKEDLVDRAQAADKSTSVTALRKLTKRELVERILGSSPNESDGESTDSDDEARGNAEVEFPNAPPFHVHFADGLGMTARTTAQYLIACHTRQHLLSMVIHADPEHHYGERPERLSTITLARRLVAMYAAGGATRAALTGKGQFNDA